MTDALTPEQREALYDDQIAPLLAQAGRLAEANGMSMTCVVEFNPGKTGETHTLAEGHDYKVGLAYVAIACHGNVDALFLAVSKHARQHGHSSLYLSRMDIPTTPEDPKP
jgi:hypothetical protein